MPGACLTLSCTCLSQPCQLVTQEGLSSDTPPRTNPILRPELLIREGAQSGLFVFFPFVNRLPSELPRSHTQKLAEVGQLGSWEDAHPHPTPTAPGAVVRAAHAHGRVLAQYGLNVLAALVLNGRVRQLSERMEEEVAVSVWVVGAGQGPLALLTVLMT